MSQKSWPILYIKLNGSTLHGHTVGPLTRLLKETSSAGYKPVYLQPVVNGQPVIADMIALSGLVLNVHEVLSIFI